jgi:hypothetical protein
VHAVVRASEPPGTFDLNFGTDDQEALEEAFDKYDDDHSGSIDTEELAALLAERKPMIEGVRITAEQVMAQFDTDGGVRCLLSLSFVSTILFCCSFYFCLLLFFCCTRAISIGTSSSSC